MATHKALVLHKYGDLPVLQDTLKPVPQPGLLLVKVDGTTINPSDRLRIQGVYFPV
jgi:NADPH:quinone reductase-like Zn-dependent oxidoreductase